jgi:transmembrane sensor
VNRQVINEAAEWFVEFNTDTPDWETRRRFDDWLRTSPEHIRAFLEIVPLWEDGAVLPLDENATAAQLIEWARAAGNVVPLSRVAGIKENPPEPAPLARMSRRTHYRPLLAAAIAVVLVGASWLWFTREANDPTYFTGIGEQRSLLLQDSSMVELNTRSRVRIHYTASERTVELLQGQALFHVAKNTSRPFVVYSGDTRVRAVGTQFDVYRKGNGTLVTVVEGSVSVYSAASGRGASTVVADDSAPSSSPVRGVVQPGTPGSVLLAAGEQLSAGPTTVQKLEQPSVTTATAWTQRRLVFDFTPLPDVAEEFNRYNMRQLVVDAPRLQNVRLSGVFSSTDPTSLIRFLREQPGVRVVESEQEIRVMHE